MLFQHKIDTAAVLEDAAQAIDDLGWCQNRFSDDEGRVCTIGAISWALNVAPKWKSYKESKRNKAEIDAVSALYDFIGTTAWQTRTGVTVWNDDKERTQFDVTNTLRKCAEDLRAARKKTNGV